MNQSMDNDLLKSYVLQCNLVIDSTLEAIYAHLLCIRDVESIYTETCGL